MTRPLELPKYVILMGDDARNGQLRYDVAKRMSEIDHTVYVDAFRAPLAEAFRAMWDRDYFKDYTDPRSSAGLLLESTNGKSELEIINSLEAWFEFEFGTELLGQLGLQRALDQQAITEYIYVFHDGALKHRKPFDNLKRHERLVYNVSIHEPDTPVDDIIAAMESYWEKLDA